MAESKITKKEFCGTFVVYGAGVFFNSHEMRFVIPFQNAYIYNISIDKVGIVNRYNLTATKVNKCSIIDKSKTSFSIHLNDTEDTYDSTCTYIYLEISVS